MKSSDEVERIVGQARLEADKTTDARILRDAGQILAESAESRPPALRPGSTLWRFIMESKMTRYSAAAVVMLAAVLVLLSPFGSSKNGSIALADVVEKVRQMPTVVHREEYVFSEIGQEEPGHEAATVTFDVLKYASEEYGVAQDVFDDKGTLIAQVYFLAETQQGMIVSHTEKKYGKVSLPGNIYNRAEAPLTPRGLVEYFTSGHYTSLGPARFGNFDVEGFETADPNVLFPVPEPLRSLFPVTDIIARLWIDVQTSLPVGVEAEFNTDRGLLTGFEKLHCECRAYDFRWNAEIPPGTFDPNIPDDYTELKVTDFIPAEAKVGLVGLGALPVIGIIIHRRRHRARRRNPAFRYARVTR
ncbi:MAG: hypothetical protein JSW27_16810 [Phycisphaerales bacterium]|nr:MAG: hypothetical protein JSW27_16810 [Phycisphaerales bacterium]